MSSRRFVNVLAQQTKLVGKSLCAVSVPFVPALQKHHQHGHFRLTEHPQEQRRTCMIGMFVLRPARNVFRRENDASLDDTLRERVYDERDWAYNIKGIDGGRPISDSSPVDGLRLAVQYGLSDAVLFGSMVATTDGAVTERSRGYIWQPYEVCSFNHVRSADPGLETAIAEQRREWQKLGLLSSHRDYPAQIMVTWSGERKHPKYDFLGCRVFHERLPSGKPVEAYIMTSDCGAWHIRKRARDFNLHNRIEDMLITLPAPSAEGVDPSYRAEAQMDLSIVPQYLYHKLDIRVANHDGGRDVLRAFARAGALSQLNLTLCQGRSIIDVLRDGSYIAETGVDAAEYTGAALEPKLQYFFNSQNYADHASTSAAPLIPSDCSGNGGDPATAHGVVKRGIPRHLEIVEAVQGVHDDVLVVTLRPKTKNFDF